jgi:ATP-dependent DNA helicase RecG
MKADEKESEMRRFVEKKTQIMVSTTVIEVGVKCSECHCHDH